jgi:hypothetical protein
MKMDDDTEMPKQAPSQNGTLANENLNQVQAPDVLL